MSAIGDYVHSTVGGYRDKTGKHSGPYFDTAATVIKKRQDMLDTWIATQGNKKDAKALEKSIDATLQKLQKLIQPGRGDAMPLRKSKKAQAIIQDLLWALPDKYVRMDLVQSVATGTINGRAYRSGLNIAGKGKTENQVKGYETVKGQMENLVTNYANRIVTAVNELQQKNASINLNSIQNYLTKVDAANADFLTRVGNLTQGSLKGESLVAAEFKTLQQQIKKTYEQLENAIGKEESYGEILSLCKDLAEALSAGIGASNHIGDLGEAIAQIAGKKLAKNAIDQIKNLGHETSKRGLNKVYFEGIIDVEDLAGTTLKYGDYTLTAKSEKQDLVDVSITLDEGEAMNLSVKTRKPNGSGGYRVGFAIANVLELLQNENQDNFINHFLNLNGLEDFQNKDETKDINDLVKKIILAKMVAGYNREVADGDYLAANYFVVIDNTPSNMHAYVVPMSKLLKYIFASGLHNKVQIPSGILEANQRIEGDGGIIIRLNNVMKRLAVPSKTSYNFTPTMLQTAKNQK